MPSFTLPMALGVGATATLGGAALSANAATTAAGIQAQAANNASANTLAMYNPPGQYLL